MQLANHRTAREGLALAATIFVLLAGTGARAADDPAQLPAPALVEALKRGGHVVYFRHAATDWSSADKVEKAGDWTSCDPERIRQLSEAGREAARAIGAAVRALAIPVGRVLSSPYCRCVETARLVTGREPETTDEVMNLRSAAYVGGRDAVIATARRLFATVPEPGTNTFVSAHGNVMIGATGEYPGEGDGVVMRPDGEGGFEILGRIRPGEWPTSE